jgi:plastocyanin
MTLFRKALFWAALSPLAFIGTAQAQDSAPQEMTVTMTNYAYAPSAVVLKANVPVKLHLVNNASKGHDFSAPQFFAAATIAPADKSKVSDGSIDVDEGQSVDVTVTPNKAGTYPLKCTHFMHAMLGMSGQITVQ